MRSITQSHWDGIMSKLLGRGLTVDAAFAWMEQRFEIENEKAFSEHIEDGLIGFKD